MARTIMITVLLGLAILLCACQEYDLQGAMITDEFDQEPASLVDILFVMDNSVSMVEEQNDVADNFDEFISHIEETNADWQIGVATTDMVDPTHRGRLVGDIPIITPDTPDYQDVFGDNIRVGTDGHPIERGLASAVAAVTAPLATHENTGFVREEAQLAIIVVSDENDCSDDGQITGDDGQICYEEPEKLIPVPQFGNRLRALKAHPTDVSFSAIVELDDDSGVASCGEAATGHRYLKLARMLGGVSRSICGEYDDIMDQMGYSVAGQRSSFQLTRTPDVCTIEVEVDETPVARDDSHVDGWSYDPDTNHLVFWGAKIPPHGSHIVITYASGRGDITAACED